MTEVQVMFLPLVAILQFLHQAGVSFCRDKLARQRHHTLDRPQKSSQLSTKKINKLVIHSSLYGITLQDTMKFVTKVVQIDSLPLTVSIQSSANKL